MLGRSNRIYILNKRRRFSVFRECQNTYLRTYCDGLSVERVLNLGAKPGDPDKQGSSYESYFPNSEFLTLDLGSDDHERHIQGDLMSPPDVGQFNLVLAMSLIEHIDRPWDAAPHITALIKPGGHLYIAMPFFYPVHEGPYYGDHWRATPSAMRFLFDRLEVVRSDLYPSVLKVVRDRKRYWRDPANTYTGFSMLLRKPE